MNQTQTDNYKWENTDKDFNKKLKPLLKDFKDHFKESKKGFKKQKQNVKSSIILPQKRF